MSSRLGCLSFSSGDLDDVEKDSQVGLLSSLTLCFVKSCLVLRKGLGKIRKEFRVEKLVLESKSCPQGYGVLALGQ